MISPSQKKKKSNMNTNTIHILTFNFTLYLCLRFPRPQFPNSEHQHPMQNMDF